MPGKILKTRIQNKKDTLANLQAANPYILAGELVTAVCQEVNVIGDGGEVTPTELIQLYVGPGYFNDLPPIFAPSSDVKAWAKVDNFVDVVVANFIADDSSGLVAEGDTVNTLINRINNNYTHLKDIVDQVSEIDSTSDLINDGEGATVPIKDFINGYQSYQFVSRDSVLNYITGLSIDDVPTIKQEVQDLLDAIQEQIDQIQGDLEGFITDEELNQILASYLQQVQIGDKDGGVILTPNSNAISSSALWDQIVDEAQNDMEAIADAAASTALEQAKEYTDTQLGSFITIQYRGPYDSYADMFADNPVGKAGIIYLVRHNHNDQDSNDPTDSDIFDEYIWVQNDDVVGSYEKVGNTDVKLTDYLRATLSEDNTGVVEGDEKSVSKVEIIEDPVGSGNKTLKITYKTLIKQETFAPGYVATGFQNGALKSSVLSGITLAGIAAGTTSTITESTTLGDAIRNLEDQIAKASASGVQSVDIATNGGLVVSGGPITSAGTLVVTHSPRATESSAIQSTVGDNTNPANFIKSIGLDAYGHIVAVTMEQVSLDDNYVSGATFSTAKTSINLQLTGEGEQFQTINASLMALPAMMLTQTDDEDDYLVLYCGNSTVLASTVAPTD